MAKVGSHAPGTPCWIDLGTTDAEGARAFYGKLFGWTFEDSGPEFGHYNICLKDGAPVAGIMQSQNPEQPVAWSIYLATPDIEETAASVPDAGGQVIVAPMKVGSLGSMMFALDPGGAAIGAWQPDEFPGVQRMGENGTPVWYEAMSKDYEKSLDFYHDVFGWDVHTMSDTPEFRYSTLGKDDAAKAGIQDASAMDVPAAWTVYLACDDVDATVAKLLELGGAEIMPLQDTPYGRMGTYADPAGAVFCLMQTSG